MIRAALILALTFIVGPLLAQEPPKLTADRDSVEYGDSCKLTWSSSAHAAFLSGIGKVAPRGSTTVTPENSTDYTLITESKGKIQFATVRVKMLGQKGEQAYPDPDDFKTGLQAQRASISYMDFLDQVTKTLQDQLSFHVRGAHLPRQPFYIVYTDRQTRNALVRPGDTGIRKRRVAYAVRIDEPRSNTVPFEVKVLVEYQRAGESAWRPEIDQDVLHSAAQDVKRKLELSAMP